MKDNFTFFAMTIKPHLKEAKDEEQEKDKNNITETKI